MTQQKNSPSKDTAQHTTPLQEAIHNFNKVVDDLVENDCFGNLARGLVKHS